MPDTYNGWPSYETWNVMLWLDNDEDAYRYYTDRIRRRKERGFKSLSAGTAHAIAENALGPETGDGVSLSNSRIRWGKIAEAMRESVDA
jgi:hypothetical protein